MEQPSHTSLPLVFTPEPNDSMTREGGNLTLHQHVKGAGINQANKRVKGCRPARKTKVQDLLVCVGDESSRV